MSLKIENLQVKVDGKLIIDGLDLEVKTGQVTALMGPNGSGKTSTAYALMGHPDYQIIKGKITLDGVDILDLSPEEKARMGLFLAFQYPVTVDGVKYGKFLWQSYQSRFKKDCPVLSKRMENVVDFSNYLVKLAQELDIQPRLLKRPLNMGFSGGEKKRLEMLQLLLLEPRYAVIDEIDSGLDIDAVRLIARVISQTVKKLKTGVLLITHYQRILDSLKPDKVMVMAQGQVVDRGGFELVQKLEKEGYTRKV